MKRSSMYVKWLSVILLTGCIYAFVVYQLSSELDKKESDIKNRGITSLQAELDSSITMFEQLALYVFNEKLNVPEVLEPMAAALDAGDTDITALIDELYDDLYSDYSSLIHYGFRAMQFEFNDGTVFLRMHRPEIYGDNLCEVRETIQQVNLKQEYVYGFEEGRIYSGYRFVYPLFYKNRYIGAVELGISPESIQNILNTASPDAFHEFIIKKDNVDDIIYDFEKSNYMISLLSDDFYYDKQAYLANSRYWDQTQSRLLHELITRMKNNPEFSTSLNAMNDFAVEEKYDDISYLVSFIVIENFEGSPAAYFISYSENEELPALRTAYYSNIFLLAMLYLIFAAVSFYYIQSRMKFEMQANIDPLTCIYNRYKFLELACMEIEKFRRYGHPMSIILFDLDFFKKVNDNYGHVTGDYVLKTVAQIINKSKRSSDLFARWGGEEFILLLPETSLSEASVVAERLRKALSDYDFDKCHKVTASFGVAELETNEENLDAIIEKVDQALYKAKTNGRNRVEEHRADEPYLFE